MTFFPKRLVDGSCLPSHHWSNSFEFRGNKKNWTGNKYQQNQYSAPSEGIVLSMPLDSLTALNRFSLFCLKCGNAIIFHTNVCGVQRDCYTRTLRINLQYCPLIIKVNKSKRAARRSGKKAFVDFFL